MRRISRFHESLREMISILNDEKKAISSLDIDAIMACSVDKQGLCSGLEEFSGTELDEESLSLLETARQINEVNRQIRNLAAANISARIDALRGSPALYSIASSSRARIFKTA